MKRLNSPRTFGVLLAVLAAACTQTPEPITTVDPTTAVLENETPEPSTPATEPVRGSLTLNLWLPPEFDPYSGTAAGELLASRIDQFNQEYPEIHVSVRVKAEEGPGGLLPSLTAASAAAPLALPDLVALPQHDLETAAIKNLVHPIGTLSDLMESDDWYEYARELVRVQESDFGFAFAGDALVLLYHPEGVPRPPNTLAASLESGEAIAFPAASPESLVTLNLYLAHGGEIEGEDGRPFLDPAPLESTLNYYEEGLQSGVTPFWLTQFESFSQSRGSFNERQSTMAVDWIADYLADPDRTIAASLLPTPGGEGVTLATGWSWALTAQDPVKLEASALLAEFLVDPEFLSQWWEALRVLPTRPSALELWPPSTSRDFLAAVANSARAVPSENLLAILGPALQDATVNVLKQLSDPQTAAQDAAGQLGNP